jgi:dephospho-CoA kinase
VVVVEADPATRIERLVGRGLSEDDARARIAAQATDEQRRAVADVVLDNSGTREQLAAQVDRFWRERVATSA